MKIYTVNSFCSNNLTGNPAGVCILNRELSNNEYLEISRKVNFSETSFVLNKNGELFLKWFSPKQEINLCGHATMAAAKVLYEEFNLSNDEITFNTKSGKLLVKQTGNKLEMNFPSYVFQKQIKSDHILEEFVKIKPLSMWEDRHWCLIEMSNEEMVKSLKPNFKLLMKHSLKSFIVTAKSSSNKYHFTSRFFGPAIGIEEDPVTGSAHCYLSTFWGSKLNINKLIGYQTSLEGGIVECELIEDNRVLLRGECKITGELKN